MIDAGGGKEGLKISSVTAAKVGEVDAAGETPEPVGLRGRCQGRGRLRLHAIQMLEKEPALLLPVVFPFDHHDRAHLAML